MERIGVASWSIWFGACIFFFLVALSDDRLLWLSSKALVEGSRCGKEKRKDGADTN